MECGVDFARPENVSGARLIGEIGFCEGIEVYDGHSSGVPAFVR